MNIQKISAEEFRQKLAGLIDPVKKLDEFEQSALYDEAVKFVSILPEVFGESLDRKTLWERIGNGLTVSLSKSGLNLENFINNMLEYIKADYGKVAANENMEMFISTSVSRPREWQQQLLRVIQQRRFLIIVKGRALWNQKKGENK